MLAFSLSLSLSSLNTETFTPSLLSHLYMGWWPSQIACVSFVPPLPFSPIICPFSTGLYLYNCSKNLSQYTAQPILSKRVDCLKPVFTELNVGKAEWLIVILIMLYMQCLRSQMKNLQSKPSVNSKVLQCMLPQTSTSTVVVQNLKSDEAQSTQSLKFYTLPQTSTSTVKNLK